jgi:FixJ family two-component response regulator
MASCVIPTIALVDDEAPVLKALGRVLRLANCTVIAFQSGESFLAWLTRAQPDCAVLDIHMPGLSGFEVLERIRATRVDIPVVFITASDDPDLARRAHKLGASALLRKPFNGDALIDAILAATGSDA